MKGGEPVGEERLAEGAGALVSSTLERAAATLARAASAAGESPGSTAVAAQADALGRRARLLGERNATAYTRARKALGGELDDGRKEARDFLLGEALRAAAESPVELAEAAADLALLATHLSEDVAEPMRADLLGVAAIAAGAARAASRLVAANLGTVPRDARVERALRAADMAMSAAGRDPV